MSRPAENRSDEYSTLVLAPDAINGLLDAAAGRVLSEVELDERLNELHSRMAGDIPAAPSN